MTHRDPHTSPHPVRTYPANDEPLARLLDLAHSDSGASPSAARVLLSAFWNSRSPFDASDLARFDEHNLAAAFHVLRASCLGAYKELTRAEAEALAPVACIDLNKGFRRTDRDAR